MLLNDAHTHMKHCQNNREIKLWECIAEQILWAIVFEMEFLFYDLYILRNKSIILTEKISCWIFPPLISVNFTKIFFTQRRKENEKN